MIHLQTINITRDHLNRGSTDRAESCPVTLALQEAGYRRAKVHEAYTLLNGEHREPDEMPLCIYHSPMVNAWLNRFIHSRQLFPVTLNLITDQEGQDYGTLEMTNQDVATLVVHMNFEAKNRLQI